jgi:hypothetical protein
MASSMSSTEICNEALKLTSSESINAIGKSDYKPAVGDIVKVVRDGPISNGHPIGTIGTVESITDGCVVHITLNGTSYAHSQISIDPTFTGTYAERQKQWVEHHGLKVGSKVRVSRVPTSDELRDHGGGFWWKGSEKRQKIGCVFAISALPKWCIGLDNGSQNAFPYQILEPVIE